MHEMKSFDQKIKLKFRSQHVFLKKQMLPKIINMDWISIAIHLKFNKVPYQTPSQKFQTKNYN